MAVTVAVIVEAIRDAEKLKKYQAVASASLEKHGGAAAAMLAQPEVLSGGMAAPKRLVLLSFPSNAAARAWRMDPALAEVHALRDAAMDSTFFLDGAAA